MAGCVLLGACDKRGFSTADSEWARRSSGPFYIVSANHDRAVVSALGRKLAIEPAEGFCVAKSALETTDRSAFALIGDCTLEAPGVTGSKDANGELALPRGVPGIITVSISGNPGLSAAQSSEAALTGLSSFLGTDEGRALLGRGRSSGAVGVLESRRIGQGIYVYIEEMGEDPFPILDKRFWRAFFEIEERFVMVTMSGFRDSPLEKDEMLRYLVNQVKTMNRVNRLPIREDGIFVEARDAGGRIPPLQDAEIADAAAGLDDAPEAVATLDDIEEGPAIWPRPRQRSGRASPRIALGGSVPVPPRRGLERTRSSAVSQEASAGQSPDTSTANIPPATKFAPDKAPNAPRRPRRA